MERIYILSIVLGFVFTLLGSAIVMSTFAKGYILKKECDVPANLVITIFSIGAVFVMIPVLYELVSMLS